MDLSVRMGLVNVLKNGRRSVPPLTGAVLAITLVAGANISIDVTSRKMLLVALKTSIIDMAILEQGVNETLGIVDRLEGMDWIASADPVVLAWGYVQVNPSDPARGIRTVPVIGVAPAFERLAGDLGLASDEGFELGPGEVLLTPDLADLLTSLHQPTSIGSNATVPLIHRYEPGTLNHSFRIKGYCKLREGSWAASMLEGGLLMDWTKAAEIVPEYGDPFSASSLPSPVPTSGGRVAGPMILVRIERDKVLVPGNPDRSRQNLNALKQDIAILPGLSEAQLWTPVDEAVRRYAEDLERSRPTFALASIPVILLGVYLAAIGFDVGFARRRMETALLKCKGLSKRQITNMFMVESMALGIIAGILGILLGSLVASVVILPLPKGKVPALSPVDPAKIGITPFTGFLGAMLGIGMICAASLRPVRDLNRASIIDSLGRYSAELSMKRYSPTRDAIFVLAPSGLYLVLLLKRLGLDARAPGLLRFIMLILADIGKLTLPLLAVMLIVGLAGLSTRWTTRTYRLISRLLKPLSGPLHSFVTGDLVRNPRRTSNVGLLIALCLAFGAFIAVYSDSEAKHQEREAEFTIGADVKVEDSSRSLQIQDLLGLEGVEEACEILLIRTDRVGMTNLFALNPEEYPSCLEGSRFLSNKLRRLLTELETEQDGVLVFRSVRWKGDETDITVPTGQEGQPSLQLKVLGSFPYAPGMRETMTTVMGDFAIANSAYIEERVSPSAIIGSRFLIRAEEGANLTRIADQIASLLPAGSLAIQVRGGHYGPEGDPNARTLSAFLKLEFLFTLVMATFGLGYVLYMSVSETEREVAGQMARGITRGQILRILVVEAITIAVVGIAIGVPVGTGTAYMMRASNDSTSHIAIPTALSIPGLLGGMVILAVIALSAGSLAGALKIGRMNLGEVLRTR